MNTTLSYSSGHLQLMFLLVIPITFLLRKRLNSVAAATAGAMSGNSSTTVFLDVLT
jgi:hypothetical protein